MCHGGIIFMFFRNHRKLIIFLIMLTVIAASGLIGYLIADSEPRVVAEKADDDDEAVQAEADNDRIAADAVITWDYEYEMCRHHLYVDTQPDPDIIGLTFTKLKNKYPDIVIVSFSADEVVLKKRLECYCPEHFLLKRNADKLAVYRTAAGTDKQDVYIDVDIDFAKLSKQQQEQLEDGRIFSDINDLQIFLKKLNRTN